MKKKIIPFLIIVIIMVFMVIPAFFDSRIINGICSVVILVASAIGMLIINNK